MDTRHARICPKAGARVNQHQPLVHAMPHTLKWLGIRHQVERGEPFTAGRNLRMDIVVRREGLRDTPNREYREKSILLEVTHTDPQAQIHLRGGSVLITLYLRGAQAPTLRLSGTCVLGRTESQTCHFRSGKLWASRGRGQLVSWGGGMVGRWEGNDW